MATEVRPISPNTFLGALASLRLLKH